MTFRRIAYDLLGGLCLAVLIGLGGALAEEPPGKALFEGLQSDVGVRLAAGGAYVPAQRMPCAGCHGRDGAGGGEGGTKAADITSHALERATALRPAYDAAALERALREGIDPSGRVLDKAMPRYGVSEKQATDVLGYLRHLSLREKSGVREDEVVFAVGQTGEEGRRLAAALSGAWRRRGEPAVWGRQVRFRPMSEAEVAVGAFAMLLPTGDRAGDGLKRWDAAGMPVLFPLSGSTRAEFVRGLHADEAEQLRRLLAAAGPQSHVLADDHGRRFLINERLAAADRIGRLDGPVAAGGSVVAVASRSALAHWLSGQRAPFKLHLLFDDALSVAPVVVAAGQELVTVDPRPSRLEFRGSDLDRLVSVAVYLIEEALAGAGRDLTRGQFLRAFDRLKLSDPAWPSLDFTQVRRTGTRELVMLSGQDIMRLARR